MGLFFKSNAEKQYIALCEEIVSETTNHARREPLLEPFEYCYSAWRHQMTKRGKAHLSGPTYASDYLVLTVMGEPMDGLVMLAQHIALFTIPGFSETKYCSNLGEQMATIYSLVVADEGGMNRIFREENPKSFALHFEQHARMPFDKTHAEAQLKILLSGVPVPRPGPG